MVRLHSDQSARVVLPDGHLAGGGPVPAAHLQDGVGGLDEFPDCLVNISLHVTVCPDKVLSEEVTVLV